MTRRPGMIKNGGRSHRGDATPISGIERRSALTSPDKTIQTLSQTPPLAPIEVRDPGHDDRIIDLVRLLARRAAEYDYAQLLLRRENIDPGTMQ